MKPQPCNPEPATIEAMYQAIREWPEGKYFGTSEVTAFVKWYYSLPVPVPAPTLEPFNLEQFKSGRKALTRDGQEVMFKEVDTEPCMYPLKCFSSDDPEMWYCENGSYSTTRESEFDLVSMVPVSTSTPPLDADGWIPWKHGDPFICDRFQITYADGIVSKVWWEPSEHDKDTKWDPDAQTVAYKPAPDATYERWEWNQETGKYERKEGGKP